MSKKGKGMNVSGSLEEFRAEFNIPLSLNLHFAEDGEVNFIMGSPDKGEMLLSKSYFEVGLKLPLPPLFKDIVNHLHLAPNQLCINMIRLTMSLAVLDHMRGLGISVIDVFYICTAMRSHIPHEWYMSPYLGMSCFIIGAPLTNKDLGRGLVVVSGKWEFGISEPEGLPKVPRVHNVASVCQC